jgi:hypothetical protein
MCFFHFKKVYRSPQHVAAEWLALLLYIQKVPGLDLGLETGYPD